MNTTSNYIHINVDKKGAPSKTWLLKTKSFDWSLINILKLILLFLLKMSFLWIFFINAFVFKCFQWAMVDQIHLLSYVEYKRKSTTNNERRYSSSVNLNMSYATTNTMSYRFQVNNSFKILTELIPIEKKWYSNHYNYSRQNWLLLIICIKNRESLFFEVLDQTHQRYKG